MGHLSKLRFLASPGSALLFFPLLNVLTVGDAASFTRSGGAVGLVTAGVD